MNLRVQEITPPPEWLKELVDHVMQNIEPISLMGHLGYRWLPPDHDVNVLGKWIIGVYPCPNEVRGGSSDGAIVHPGFKIKIQSVLSRFSDVKDMVWIQPTAYTGGLEGPQLRIEGKCGEHDVRFQLFAASPSGEDASLVIDHASGSWWPKEGG